MINGNQIIRELDFERLTGSAGELKARKIITAYLKELGLKVTTESFEINTFETGSATLSVDGRDFDVLPYGLESDNTIKGEFVLVQNPEILRYNTGAFEGKIVAAFGAARGIAEVLEAQKVAAFLSIQAPDKKGNNASHRQKLCIDGRMVPSASITYRDAEKLTSKSGKPAILKISQKMKKGRGTNIITTVGKPEIDRSLTYLVGHYDSVARSHGSTDNAGGVACMIKLAEYFVKHPPKRELKLIFFSGEEMGLRGSFAYVKKHKAEITDRAKLVVNMDVAGDPIGRDQLTVIGTRDTLGYAGGVMREDGLAFIETLGVYSSDGIPFSVEEVPSINLYRNGGKGSNMIHTADDVARNTTTAGLQISYKAGEAVLKRILNGTVYPVRREIDDSLRDRLEKYLWGTLLEKPVINWTEKYRK